MTLEVHYADDAALPGPAIWSRSHGAMYTGTQLMSHCLPRINYASGKLTSALEGGAVRIERGELVYGRLNKKALGKSAGGVVHLTCLDLGERRAMQFLSDVQRLICVYMQGTGDSIGLGDCLVEADTNERVSSAIDEILGSITREYPKGPTNEQEEHNVTRVLNSAIEQAGKSVLDSMDPHTNGFRRCVDSGSKGSKMNIAQVAGCVGQVCVNGARITGSLPCYPRGQKTNVTSGGFCSNNYVLGLTPQEYYVHAMGGREGLVDTAVKTASTGYLQRRLVKVMEDLCVAQDGSVRNSQQQIVVGRYGVDGQDAQFLERVSVPELAMSDAEIDALYDDREDPEAAQSIKRLRASIRRVKASFESELVCSLHVPFHGGRCADNLRRRAASDDSLPAAADVIAARRRVLAEVTCPLTRLVTFCTLSRGGILRIPGGGSGFVARLADDLIRRVARARIAAGTMVGPIAASSIGEPCTQMTLNTFHSAGIASKNVTLGVPRFKELLDVSKNIRTPSMTLPLRNDLGDHTDFCDDLTRRMRCTMLEHLVQNSRIVGDEEWEQHPNDDFRFVMRLGELMRLEPLPDPARYAIVLELDRRAMFEHGVLIAEVRDAVHGHLGDRAEILATEHSMETTAIIVRFVGVGAIIGRAKLGDDVAADELRRLEYAAMTRLRDVLLNKMYIKGINGVQRAFVQPLNRSVFDAGGEHAVRTTKVIETEGSNVVHAVDSLSDVVDVYAVRTNDVSEAFQRLGVEAAAKTLAREMLAVLSFDGAYINYRWVRRGKAVTSRLPQLCPNRVPIVDDDRALALRCCASSCGLRQRARKPSYICRTSS